MITSGSERVCLDERRHVVVLAGPFVRALGLAVVGIGCMAIGWPASIAGVLLQAGGAAIALRAVWKWERTRVVLTTEKLFVVHGTLHRRAAAVRLSRLGAIEIEQSLVGRLLGYGTIVAGDLEIEYVLEPRRVVRPGRAPERLTRSRLPKRVCRLENEHLFDPIRLAKLGRLWRRKSSSSTVPGSTTSRTSTVRLPRNKLICITGPSGSGKSSLAFDTIYAEGQRRYVESLSAYARQFLQMMEKPDVDSIDGLSPAISIDQKTTSRNPRSTVGTVTEIYDYLRLLYARVGRPHCPVCGKPITGQSQESIVDQILQLPEGTKFTVNAPVVRDRKGEYKDVFEELRNEGFTRVRSTASSACSRTRSRSTRSSSTRSRWSSTV